MQATELNRDSSLEQRKGRTPFRLELKFTPEEWREFGERASAHNTSRYNFAKKLLLHGVIVEINHGDLDAPTN